MLQVEALLSSEECPVGRGWGIYMEARTSTGCLLAATGSGGGGCEGYCKLKYKENFLSIDLKYF